MKQAERTESLLGSITEIGEVVERVLHGYGQIDRVHVAGHGHFLLGSTTGA